MVAHVSSQLTCSMTEEEAVAISKCTHLFGYRPEIFRHPVATRLCVLSDSDARLVEKLRDEMRASRSNPNAPVQH